MNKKRCEQQKEDKISRDNKIMGIALIKVAKFKVLQKWILHEC